MDTSYKITLITDAYCNEDPDKIIVSVDLRDGNRVYLTLRDFEVVFDALEQS